MIFSVHLFCTHSRYELHNLMKYVNTSSRTPLSPIENDLSAFCRTTTHIQHEFAPFPPQRLFLRAGRTEQATLDSLVPKTPNIEHSIVVLHEIFETVT